MFWAPSSKRWWYQACWPWWQCLRSQRRKCIRSFALTVNRWNSRFSIANLVCSMALWGEPRIRIIIYTSNTIYPNLRPLTAWYWFNVICEFNGFSTDGKRNLFQVGLKIVDTFCDNVWRTCHNIAIIITVVHSLWWEKQTERKIGWFKTLPKKLIPLTCSSSQSS